MRATCGGVFALGKKKEAPADSTISLSIQGRGENGDSLVAARYGTRSDAFNVFKELF